ncbi:PPOX class F420-dependent oxidoreductase [Haliea sp. E1-2-M8]|uniref:PPOX class F420-dependent oxidoreductase n=1 Tax=Haliea sp. E1-2-M8 TaxID=3064706 RepID=UPI00271E3BF8|nr:PPOX class F420-dependent oxidoreductase [Haliea sp. E1-2-M8]MDO8862645.1 PPOX class F420-dependent oxidoreductase [Haliea sp. E1-2-M8]
MDSKLLARLERGAYVSFATRKRSGEFVPTPVWFAPGDGGYYLFSAGDAGKVKRLRNFSEARLAPCTVTGRITGDRLAAQAFLLEQPEDIARALAALRRKYGWQMHLLDALSRAAGKLDRRAYIRVAPDPAAG